MTLLDQILARLPEERHRDFLRAVHALNVRPDSPDLVQAYLAIEALAPMLAEINYAKGDIIAGMRAAGTQIVKGLADDIVSQSVESFARGGAETIRVGIVPALLTVAADHRASMEATAVKLELQALAFARQSQKAQTDLVVAAADVRNKANAIARLHATHMYTRLAWAVPAAILFSAASISGTLCFKHAQCVASAQRFRTHSDRAMLEAVFCK